MYGPWVRIPAESQKKKTGKTYDSVAQLVEQYTFNVWVLGSNPSGITKYGQVVELVDTLL
jgi:hypothetical protein